VKLKLDKLFSTPQTLAPTGTQQSDAAPMEATAIDATTFVSAGDGTAGIILPPVLDAWPGRIVTVFNSGSGTLKVYPPTSAAINAGLTNAAASVATKTYAIFQAISATQYGALGTA